MNKEKIVEEIARCLDLHMKKYNLEQINKHVDKWYKNKRGLIDILRKHPNWNEDAMAVLFDYDYKREMDYGLFSDTLANIWQEYCLSFVGKVVKLPSVEEICKDYSIPYQGDFYFRGIHYNQNIKILFGKEVLIDECALSNWRFFVRSADYSGWIPVEFCETTVKINIALNVMYQYCFSQNILQDSVDIINENIIDCTVGQKTSRVLNKYFTKVGINKLENYNKLFAKLADSISVLNIKRHTLLSVHPCDYLHMSYGGSSKSNGANWRSCHSLDQGSYEAGTLSYMLDKTSMILYTVNGTYEENEFWSQHKINRQVFCYDNYALLQSRLYPDYNDTTTIESFRTVVQDIFSKCLEKDNLWVVKISTSGFKDHIKTHTRSKHYKDYDRSGIKHYLSLLKGEEHGIIKIGSNPPCVKCGKLFRNNDGSKQILCDYCLGLQCECCGRIKKYINNLQEIEGKFYCTDCYQQCEACGEYVVGKPNLVKTATSKCLIICNKCITNKKKYVRCIICGDYIHHYYANKTNNGVCFCDTCQQRGFSENNMEFTAVNQQNRT